LAADFQLSHQAATFCCGGGGGEDIASAVGEDLNALPSPLLAVIMEVGEGER
jgi:hypothetical protein